MSSRGKAGKVLVVEDDTAIRDLVAETLRAEDYWVAAVADFPAAVDALAHTRFDLVLADALGAAGAPPGADPLKDRYAVLDRIRELAGYSPVVIFTALRGGDFPDFRERGFSDLLLKPFDLEELLATVERNRIPNVEQGSKV